MCRTRRSPAGFTLVEVIAATAILAALTTASFTLVRTANDAWRQHRSDSLQRGQAIAGLQHIVRRVRQATSVTAISAAADASGYLTLQMPDGTSALWDHNAGTNEVLYGTVAANNLLADGITQLTFVGFTASGAAQTTDVAKIHAVRCTAQYMLTRPSGTTPEVVSCVAWLRAW